VLSAGYLTSQQRKIWAMRLNGYSQAKIARELGVTRQAINKYLNIIDNKVNEALLETARVNKIDLKRVDFKRGIALGYSPEFKVRVIVSYSASNGVQLWYEHKGQCEKCEKLDKCREILLVEAKERNLKLTETETTLPPSKLADTIFIQILGRVKE